VQEQSLDTVSIYSIINIRIEINKEQEKVRWNFDHSPSLFAWAIRLSKIPNPAASLVHQIFSSSLLTGDNTFFSDGVGNAKTN
jgi:hypothetical protein